MPLPTKAALTEVSFGMGGGTKLVKYARLAIAYIGARHFDWPRSSDPIRNVIAPINPHPSAAQNIHLQMAVVGLVADGRGPFIRRDISVGTLSLLGAIVFKQLSL